MRSTRDREHAELAIEGMTCASCAARIERKLNRLGGVSATVNYATERAAVDYDQALSSPEDVLEAVAASGFEATVAGTDTNERRR